MTDQHTHGTPPQPHAGHAGHGGHSWLMIACCIPMLVIAIALVATGIAPAGLVFAAIACTAMMALMMRGMDHDGGQARDADAGHERTGPR